MRWPKIEPGSTAWKATMLITIPPKPKPPSVIHFEYVNLPNFLILKNAAIMR